jgi:hypothetical protein
LPPAAMVLPVGSDGAGKGHEIQWFREKCKNREISGASKDMGATVRETGLQGLQFHLGASLG